MYDSLKIEEIDIMVKCMEVRLYMDNHGKILIYQSEDGLAKIEVKIHNKTVWLTQQQIADLFRISRTNVVEYIAHIL